MVHRQGCSGAVCTTYRGGAAVSPGTSRAGPRVPLADDGEAAVDEASAASFVNVRQSGALPQPIRNRRFLRTVLREWVACGDPERKTVQPKFSAFASS